MTPLQTFANGDTNYISKHNNNNSNIKSAIEALEATATSYVAASAGIGAAYPALFGTTRSVIGVDSYKCTGSGTDLTVAAGFSWKPSVSIVVRLVAPVVLSFTGLSSATYYISSDNTGAPVRSTTAGPEDLYSVIWTGTVFGAITLLAPIVWGAADDILAQVSTALATTYTKLDTRLEAGETITVATAAEVTTARNSVLNGAYGSLDARLEAIESGAISGTGTVTTVSVVTANGLGGTVATPTTTPAITLTTGITGILKGNGTAISAATSGTDYSAGTSALATGIIKSTTTTGALTIAVAGDFPTLNQSTTGSAATLTTSRNIDGQGFNGSADITVIAPGTHAATSKVTPVDADEVPLVDSAASFVLKRLTWSNLKATLKTYFDTLYGAGSGSVTSVAMTVPAHLSVSGSPITTNGTLAVTLSGTALPVANGGTGITSFGTGVATFLGTPSSANLAAALTDETGSGAAVFSTSPTLVTPALGTPSALVLTNATGATGANFGTQTAKFALMGPTSGSAANPAFRALAAGDLPVAPNISTLTYAATVSVDLTGLPNNAILRCTLTGNVTFNFTGGTDGQKVMMEIKQDATGSRLVTLGTGIAYGTDIAGFTATTAANKTDVLGIIYNSAATGYRLIAVVKGY